MRTLAMLIGAIFVLAFFVFAWLSHAGVLPHGGGTHLLAGTGLFVFAVGGAWFLAGTYFKTDPDSLEYKDGRLLLALLCIVGMLNGFAFSVLRPFSIVGPEDSYMASALWIIYAIISFFSGVSFYNNFVKES